MELFFEIYTKSIQNKIGRLRKTFCLVICLLPHPNIGIMLYATSLLSAQHTATR